VISTLVSLPLSLFFLLQKLLTNPLLGNFSFTQYFFLVEGPEIATRGDEWELQISFEIFGRCPKIKP
jgi:hypothetical protein